MLQNYDVSITDFLQMTQNGLKVASFVQIKSAIIKRYKETYGNDIDVSTNTADGVFVNDLALIMNNILQTVLTIYNNLDVNTANGKYLDILCNLSNVTRKQATYSTASLTIQNDSVNDLTLQPNLEFVDKAGQEWIAVDITNDTVIPANQSISIKVRASTKGPIKAPAGYIFNTIDNSLPISVFQENAAIVGDNIETDEQLRARRSEYGSSTGITVLESLASALLTISDVKDVKIYNNASSVDSDNELYTLSKPQDNTVIQAHNIYIILRAKEDAVLNSSIIGSTIYTKLTPGISTTNYIASSNNGIASSYDYIPSIIGSDITAFTQKVYWKQAVAKNEELTISITPFKFFANTTLDVIGQAVQKYLNQLPIGITPSLYDIQNIVVNADPKFKSNMTFAFNDCTVNNATITESNFKNNDNYYNYTNIETNSTGSTYTITLS